MSTQLICHGLSFGSAISCFILKSYPTVSYFLLPPLVRLFPPFCSSPVFHQLNTLCVFRSLSSSLCQFVCCVPFLCPLRVSIFSSLIPHIIPVFYKIYHWCLVIFRHGDINQSIERITNCCQFVTILLLLRLMLRWISTSQRNVTTIHPIHRMNSTHQLLLCGLMSSEQYTIGREDTWHDDNGLQIWSTWLRGLRVETLARLFGDAHT